MLTMGMLVVPRTPKMRYSPHSRLFLVSFIGSIIIFDCAQGFSFTTKPLVSRSCVSQRCTATTAKKRTKSLFAFTLEAGEATTASGTISSVVRIEEAYCSASLRNAWTRLVPPVWETNSRGVDVRVQWNHDDDDSNMNREGGELAASSTSSTSAAATILQQVQHQLPTKLQIQDTENMKKSLAESMQLFQEFCQEHLKGACHFQVRLTASRGITGTKCPVWHMDHVPVRWIQSLVGPGCQWVGQEDAVASVEQWSTKVHLADNDNDNDSSEWMAQSTKERNRELIGATATTHQAAPGEAVLLIGNRWSELAAQNNDDDDESSNIRIPAAIHKSPDQLLPWQGRVLVTMDVLYD
jgi:hypothetical protein